MNYEVKVLLAAGMVIGAACLCSCSKEGGAGAKAESDTATVPVGKVERRDLSITEVIPAEFRAYVDVQLHAKVSGYLNQMNVDFGDRVTNGQLLITIDVPELQAQYDNALANERRAEANYANAHLIYSRLDGVNKEHPGLVARQDIDTAFANETTTKAQIAADKAEVERYRTLASYTNVTAPFDGIVTHRYVDPGALVEAGTSSGNTQPLLEVADNYHLRLDFPVSVTYVKNIHVGDTISGTVESLNERSFTGKITRATWQVNDDTRTMTTEIEVPNEDLALVPGMYCTVTVPVERRQDALSVPIEAVPPKETNDVFVVNEQNEIERRPVKLGIATATRYEIVSGLKEGELVLTGSRSKFRPGQKVTPKLINPGVTE